MGLGTVASIVNMQQSAHAPHLLNAAGTTSVVMCTGAIQRQDHAAERASAAELDTVLDELIEIVCDEPYYCEAAERGKLELISYKREAARCRALFDSTIKELEDFMSSLPPDCIPPQESLDLLQESD